MPSTFDSRHFAILALSAMGFSLPGQLGAQAMLRPGVVAKGELKTGDLKLDDNTYADLWRVNGTRGQQVRITMRAPSFDSYLQLGYYSEKGDWLSVDSDDEGAGGTDSQISISLPRDAEFTVRANTLKVGEMGSYTLLLETGSTSGPAPGGTSGAGANPLISSVPGAHMPLVLGQWLSGTLGAGDDTLSDGSPADIWVYQGRRGETLTIVQKSDAVDSYVTFGEVLNGRWTWAEADNNGAGGKDSRLVVTLEDNGEYWVRPNALFSGKGPYTLYVTSSAGGQSAAVQQPEAPSGSTLPAVGAVGPLQQGLTPGASAPQSTPSQSASSAPSGGQRAEIQLGQTIRGRLGAGDAVSFDTTYIDTYVFRGRRGDRINIIMISPDFGSYLLFGKEPASGNSFSSMEHVGATNGREAKITVTVPDDGTYWIQANQFDRADGSYVLTLESAR
jgi:hypothetical protein